MLGVVLAALASAAPSPTPLKTISHIHASPFCTAMRENIGHAVGALIANKAAIGDGKSVLLQMAHDKISRTSPGLVLDVDMVEVDRVIGAMVKNLALTDAALNDLKHIPAQPSSVDERRLAQMRDELRAIADTQRRTLDLFSGMYESYSSNELLGKGNPLKGAAGPDHQAPQNLSAKGGEDQGAPMVIPPSTSHGAQAPSPPPSSAPNASPTPVPQMYEGLAAYTPFARMFNTVTTYQLQEEPLEAQAAQSILKYSQECK